MSIRETLNKNSTTSTALAVVVLIAAVGLLLGMFWRPSPYKKGGYTEVFFTNDDGQTYFADNRLKVPPYDKDGKPAVRAQVVRCGSGKPFVAFMSRYNERAAKSLNEAAAGGKLTQEMLDGYFLQTEAKKPGEKEWVSADKASETGVTTITCPKAGDRPLPVYP